jgi:hypothetical protein
MKLHETSFFIVASKQSSKCEISRKHINYCKNTLCV